MFRMFQRSTPSAQDIASAGLGVCAFILATADAQEDIYTPEYFMLAKANSGFAMGVAGGTLALAAGLAAGIVGCCYCLARCGGAAIASCRENARSEETPILQTTRPSPV